jgi:hypothetical protein
VGSSSSTFHHQYQDGTSGALVEDGPQLASNYAFTIPTTAPISRPFGVATGSSGGVGPEFSFTDTYPRFSAFLERRFYSHASGQTGSAVVRLQEPGASPSSARFVVNGLDKTTSSGSSFIARYSVVSLLHGFFVAGLPSAASRIPQLPRVEITSPTLTTEIVNPSVVTVQWKRTWTRWDGQRYTTSYPTSFSEPASDLRFVPLYSRDEGETWLHMLDDTPAKRGTLPMAGGVPDTSKVLTDTGATEQSYAWPTPATEFPAGTYLIRVETFSTARPLHFAHHMERIYVDR